MTINTNNKLVNVEEGSKVQFSCSAQGFPKPQVHWVKKLRPDRVLSKIHTLVLNQVEPENAGEYLCVATNSEGRSEDGLELNVFCKIHTLSYLKSFLLHTIQPLSV